MNKIGKEFGALSQDKPSSTPDHTDGSLTPPPTPPRTRPGGGGPNGPRHSRFADLSRLIGKAAAEKLVAHYGGRRINIPTTMPPRHKLAQTIGHAKAKLLARAYGGTWLVVPVGPASFQKKKQDRALALLAEGRTIKDITRLTGLSDRSIQRLKAKMKKGD